MRPAMPLLTILAILTACGGGGEGPTAGGPGGGGGGGGGGGNPVQTTSVNIQGSSFNPSAIRVAPGATVTWTNSDNIAHNVSFSSSSVPDITQWTSGNRSTTMPATTGTYSYSCTLHAGMNGSVQVAQ